MLESQCLAIYYMTNAIALPLCYKRFHGVWWIGSLKHAFACDLLEILCLILTELKTFMLKKSRIFTFTLVVHLWIVAACVHLKHMQISQEYTLCLSCFIIWDRFLLRSWVCQYMLWCINVPKIICHRDVMTPARKWSKLPLPVNGVRIQARVRHGLVSNCVFF